MSEKLASHPHRALMEEAKRERDVADNTEGEALREAIYKAGGSVISIPRTRGSDLGIRS
jgi:hypothetical protein